MFKFLKNLFKSNPQRKGRIFALGVVMSLGDKDKESLRRNRKELLTYVDNFLDPSQTAYDEKFSSILEHVAITGNGKDALEDLLLAGLIDSVIDQISEYSGNDAKLFVKGIRSVLVLV